MLDAHQGLTNAATAPAPERPRFEKHEGRGPDSGGQGGGPRFAMSVVKRPSVRKRLAKKEKGKGHRKQPLLDETGGGAEEVVDSKHAPESFEGERRKRTRVEPPAPQASLFFAVWRPSLFRLTASLLDAAAACPPSERKSAARQAQAARLDCRQPENVVGGRRRDLDRRAAAPD
jgi:hypothetical protein